MSGRWWATGRGGRSITSYRCHEEGCRRTNTKHGPASRTHSPVTDLNNSLNRHCRLRNAVSSACVPGAHSIPSSFGGKSAENRVRMCGEQHVTVGKFVAVDRYTAPDDDRRVDRRSAISGMSFASRHIAGGLFSMSRAAHTHYGARSFVRYHGILR